MFVSTVIEVLSVKRVTRGSLEKKESRTARQLWNGNGNGAASGKRPTFKGQLANHSALSKRSFLENT